MPASPRTPPRASDPAACADAGADARIVQASASESSAQAVPTSPGSEYQARAAILRRRGSAAPTQRPFRCKYCSYAAYAKRAGLNQHIRHMHPTKPRLSMRDEIAVLATLPVHQRCFHMENLRRRQRRGGRRYELPPSAPTLQHALGIDEAARRLQVEVKHRASSRSEDSSYASDRQEVPRGSADDDTASDALPPAASSRDRQPAVKQRKQKCEREPEAESSPLAAMEQQVAESAVKTFLPDVGSIDAVLNEMGVIDSPSSSSLLHPSAGASSSGAGVLRRVTTIWVWEAVSFANHPVQRWIDVDLSAVSCWSVSQAMVALTGVTGNRAAFFVSPDGLRRWVTPEDLFEDVIMSQTGNTVFWCYDPAATAQLFGLTVIQQAMQPASCTLPRLLAAENIAWLDVPAVSWDQLHPAMDCPGMVPDGFSDRSAFLHWLRPLGRYLRDDGTYSKTHCPIEEIAREFAAALLRPGMFPCQLERWLRPNSVMRSETMTDGGAVIDFNASRLTILHRLRTLEATGGVPEPLLSPILEDPSAISDAGA